MVLGPDTCESRQAGERSQLSAEQVLANSESRINDGEIDRNPKLRPDIYQFAAQCRAIRINCW